VNLLYIVELVYNRFVCSVNSPITLHFIRSRWHLLHAFQFVYNVNSAITFFNQPPRGAVIGKFFSNLACYLKPMKVLACCFLPEKKLYGNCLHWCKYVRDFDGATQWLKATVPGQSVGLWTPASVIVAARRVGVSKCGARFETLFRGAWRNDSNQWCYKGEARKGDTKTSRAETSIDSTVKPNKLKNCNPSSLATQLPDLKGVTSVVPAECSTCSEVLSAVLVDTQSWKVCSCSNRLCFSRQK